jgi:hypothetical protein
VIERDPVVGLERSRQRNPHDLDLVVDPVRLGFAGLGLQALGAVVPDAGGEVELRPPHHHVLTGPDAGGNRGTSEGIGRVVDVDVVRVLSGDRVGVRAAVERHRRDLRRGQLVVDVEDPDALPGVRVRCGRTAAGAAVVGAGPVDGGEQQVGLGVGVIVPDGDIELAAGTREVGDLVGRVLDGGRIGDVHDPEAVVVAGIPAVPPERQVGVGHAGLHRRALVGDVGAVVVRVMACCGWAPGQTRDRDGQREAQEDDGPQT